MEFKTINETMEDFETKLNLIKDISENENFVFKIDKSWTITIANRESNKSNSINITNDAIITSLNDSVNMIKNKILKFKNESDIDGVRQKIMNQFKSEITHKTQKITNVHELCLYKLLETLGSYDRLCLATLKKDTEVYKLYRKDILFAHIALGEIEKVLIDLDKTKDNINNYDFNPIIKNYKDEKGIIDFDKKYLTKGN